MTRGLPLLSACAKQARMLGALLRSSEGFQAGCTGGHAAAGAGRTRASGETPGRPRGAVGGAGRGALPRAGLHRLRAPAGLGAGPCRALRSARSLGPGSLLSHALGLIPGFQICRLRLASATAAPGLRQPAPHRAGAGPRDALALRAAAGVQSRWLRRCCWCWCCRCCVR